MKKFVFTILLLTVCSVHAQTADKETLKKISQDAVSSYQKQKYDDAVKFGQQAVDLSLKIYGAEHLETAVAYTNLGVIYHEKKKLKESIESLQKAVNIYQKHSESESKKLIKAYETLAFSQFADNKNDEAEANYLKAIEIAETKFGKESKESFSPTLNLANFYARDKKFEKADEFYLKGYAVAIKNFEKEGKEIDQIEDLRSCLVTGRNYTAENYKAFREAREKLFGRKTLEQAGILNGKAKSLPKPAYPSEARMQRLSGTVSVKVKIDEQGNVTEARAICGHPILGKASEDSARGAKFEPTMIDGKPTKVSGIIVYNFVP